MKYVFGVFLFLAAIVAVVLLACKYVNPEPDSGPETLAEMAKCKQCNKEIEAGQTVCIDCVQKKDDEIAKQKEYIEKTAKWFVRKFKKPACDNKFFTDIKKQCDDILKHGDDPIVKDSKIYKFAEEFNKWNETTITVRIKNIKYKKDPKASDNVQFNSCYLHLVNEKGEEYSKERNVEFYQEAAMEEKDLPVMAYKTIKPGETPYLTIHWSRYTAFNELYYNKQLPFNPHTQKEFGCDLFGLGLAYVKVSCSVEAGEIFSDMLNRVFGTPTPALDAVLDKEKE